MMESYDVAVIGAGPAGAVAAVLCARSGLKVVLVEKQGLPRVKTCGGGVTAKSIALLKTIDCFREESFERFVSALMIHLPKTGASHELISETPFMGTVSRADFDMGLVEMASVAGAAVRVAESFIQYRRTKPHPIEIKTEKSVFKTDILIGADGVHSRVRRQVQQETAGGEKAVRPVILGVACDIPLNAADRLSAEHCHLFFNVMENTGYGWAFPRKEFFNIGLVIYTGGHARQGGRPNPIQLLKNFTRNISGKEIAGQRLGVAPIPLVDPRTTPCVQRENVLLVGDAAGFADAWTGEGIYYGLKSAVAAHRVIHAAVADQKGLDCLSDYGRLCRKSFYRELKRSARACGFFKNHPSAYDLLKYRKIRALFLPHTRGEIGYLKAFLTAFIYSLGYRASILRNGDMP